MPAQLPQVNWKTISEERNQEAQLLVEYAKLNMDLPPGCSTYQLKMICVFAVDTLPITLDLGFELPGMGTGYTLRLDNQGRCTFIDHIISSLPVRLGTISMNDNRATIILTRQDDKLWIEFGDKLVEMVLDRRGDSFMYTKDTEVNGLGILVLEEVILSIPA